MKFFKDKNQAEKPEETKQLPIPTDARVDKLETGQEKTGSGYCKGRFNHF